MAVLERYNYGPLFTPPSLQKPTIEMPGIAGGASWSGAAFDPETGTYYVSPRHASICGQAVEVVGTQCDYFGEMTPVETTQAACMLGRARGLNTGRPVTETTVRVVRAVWRHASTTSAV